MHRQRGFTLIEIAIVLVILGLLLGAVMKGQELITSARVRNMIAQQDGVKVAFLGFQDRYGAFAGDYSFATRNVPRAGGDGNGDGRIEATGSPPEVLLVWDHLANSGFINGGYTASGAASYSAATNPANAYNVFLEVIHDANYFGTTPPLARTNAKTGSQIPVGEMAEIDRKIDDGLAGSGAFRGSQYQGGGGTGTCWDTAGRWLVGSGYPNCGGASIY